MRFAYSAPSTTVLMASDNNAPTQMPMANGRTSRIHSGHPATARRVARSAHMWPIANHNTMLRKNANTYAEFDDTAGTPSMGSTGTEISSTKKPRTPKSEPGSATKTSPMIAIASEAPTAISPPRCRTWARWKAMPSWITLQSYEAQP